MAAGRWNSQFELIQDSDGNFRVEQPAGPMELGPNEEAIWLGAWITQRATGATQWSSTRDFPDEANWITDSGHGNGSFQPGGAIGYTLLATHNTFNDTNGFYYWPDELLLVDDELIVDAELIQRFEQEIEDFRELPRQIEEAIPRAYQRLDVLRNKTKK